jgi:hypothetical protein
VANPNGKMMSLYPRWSISCRAISLTEASDKTGVNLSTLKHYYREGIFGPVPTAVRDVSMYDIATILVLKAAEKLGLPLETVRPMLPIIAGATYVKYQLTEIAEGRCNPLLGTGTPDLNIQLGVLLASDKAPAELEERLPGGPTQTRRYACFDETDCFACDDLGEIEQPLEALRIIDAWQVARGMKQAIAGERLQAHIA